MYVCNVQYWNAQIGTHKDQGPSPKVPDPIYMDPDPNFSHFIRIGDFRYLDNRITIHNPK